MACSNAVHQRGVWVAFRCLAFGLFLMSIDMPNFRHQKGLQAAPIPAGEGSHSIDEHSAPLQTEDSCRTTVPVPSREKQAGFLLPVPKRRNRRRSRYLPQRTFLVPPVHRPKPMHPFKRRAAVHRLSSDLVPPWPLCPALLRRPVKKATAFFKRTQPPLLAPRHTRASVVTGGWLTVTTL